MSEAKEDVSGRALSSVSVHPTDDARLSAPAGFHRRVNQNCRRSQKTQLRCRDESMEKDRVHNTDYTDDKINLLGGGGNSMELSSTRDDRHILAPLELLSQQEQQLSDGLVGRFSMATLNSDTTIAEHIAHEMEVAMAWWSDHGLDMKASGSSPMEMPVPASMLEDEAKDLSSSNHKDCRSKSTNSMHRARLPTRSLQSCVDNETRPNDLMVVHSAISHWHHRSHGETTDVTKDNDTTPPTIPREIEFNTTQSAVVNSFSANETVQALQQSPLHQERKYDDLIEEGVLLSRLQEEFRQPKITNELSLSITSHSEKVRDDIPIVSDSSSCSAGDSVEDGKSNEAAVKQLESITTHGDDDGDDVGNPPVAPSDDGIAVRKSKSSVMLERSVERVGEKKQMDLPNIDNAKARVDAQNQAPNAFETLNQGNPAKEVRQQGSQGPFSGPSTTDLLANGIDYVKKVQIELGLSVETGDLGHEAQGREESEFIELYAELRAIRCQLGIIDRGDGRESDGPLSCDPMATSAKDHLERDLLNLRRELGIVGCDIEAQTDVNQLADGEEGMSIAVRQDLSKKADEPSSCVSFFPSGYDTADRNDAVATHAFAASAVLAASLEESPEMKKAKGMETKLAATLPAYNPPKPQDSTPQTSDVGARQSPPTSQQRRRRASRPGAVAVPGIGPSGSTSQSMTATTLATTNTGGNDTADVGDPSDLLVSATLVDEAGVPAVIISDEPVFASPLPQLNPSRIFDKPWKVRATVCLFSTLCLALVGVTVLAIPGVVLGVSTNESLAVGGATPTPSSMASEIPSALPTASNRPSDFPSSLPSQSVNPSVSPTAAPTSSPSVQPSEGPSSGPSVSPSQIIPSSGPSEFPSLEPSSSLPSVRPSSSPSLEPSNKPSIEPSESNMPSSCVVGQDGIECCGNDLNDVSSSECVGNVRGPMCFQFTCVGYLQFEVTWSGVDDIDLSVTLSSSGTVVSYLNPVDRVSGAFLVSDVIPSVPYDGSRYAETIIVPGASPQRFDVQVRYNQKTTRQANDEVLYRLYTVRRGDPPRIGDSRFFNNDATQTNTLAVQL